MLQNGLLVRNRFSLLLFITALALVGYSTHALATTSDAVLTVTTASARSALRPKYLYASGRIMPWDEVSIDAQISGLPIVTAPIRVGDQVRKGQLLARFEQAPVRLQIAEARAALSEAQASADEALTDRARAVHLEGSGLLSQQQILAVKTKAAVALAKLAAAHAALDAARLAFVHTIVIAPASGVISARTVTLGRVATLGMPLFRLIRQNRLQWLAELTGPQLAEIHRGMTAVIKLSHSKYVHGIVRLLAPSLNASTQIGLAYINLAPNPAVRAGMYVKGRITLGIQRVVLVPSSSLITRSGHTYAVAVKNHRALFLRVTVAHWGPKTTEILRGVAPGVQLITQGAGLLSNGSPVNVVLDNKPKNR